MSGAIGATTLQDFLVNIRYVVDQSSQNNFLSGLQRAALGTKGLAVEVAGLVTGIFALSKVLADAGEKYYWMSQRLGTSVQSIQDFSFAMSNLGMTAEQAEQSLEQFGAWTRSVGPAADGFLRMMGATATDTTEKFKQLALELNRGGLNYAAQRDPTRRWQYALQLAKMRSIPGMTEQIVLGAEDEASFEQQQRRIRAEIGLTEEVLQEQAKTSRDVKNEWRLLGAEYNALRLSFSATFEKLMLPVWQRLVEVIEKHLPVINAFFLGLAKVLVLVATAAVSFIDILAHIVDGFVAIYNMLDRFAPSLHIVQDAMLAFGAVLLASPIGRFVVLLTYLIALMDDYSAYESGGKSSFGNVWKFLDDLGGKADALTGVEHSLAGIALAMGAIALALRGGAILRFFGLLGAARVGAAAAAATAAGVAGAATQTAARGIGGLIGPAIVAYIGVEIARYFWDLAKEKGFDPGKQGPASWGEQAGAWVREHILGIKPAAPAPPAATATPTTPTTPTTATPTTATPTTPATAAPTTPTTSGVQPSGAATVEQVKEHLRRAMDAQGYNDPASRAGLAAVIQGESGFRPRSEESYAGSSAAHIREIFSATRGMSDAEINALKANPEAFFNKVYGGRLGNAADEGFKYRGRGLIQITGKGNYERYGKMIGVDLVGNPDLANDPAVAAAIAVAYIKDRNKGSGFEGLKRAIGNAVRETEIIKDRQFAQNMQTGEFSRHAAPVAPAAPAAPATPSTAPPPVVAQTGGIMDQVKQWSLSTFFGHPAVAAEVDRATRPGATPPSGDFNSMSRAGSQGRPVTINQQTTVQVAPGADAANTAARVAQAQGRVNENLVRNTAGVIR